MAILVFIVILSILVVVHELGHYFVARLCGVKIITFSIGFGPKLIKFHSKHNEWCISLIPLGGYVRMVNELEGKVEPALLSMAFNRKLPWQKILIAFAGPLFNIIFAIGAYSTLSIIYGVEQLNPIIATIDNDLANLNKITIPNDAIITSINNINVKTWDEADQIFKKENLKSDRVIIKYKINTNESYQILDLKQLKSHYLNQSISLETLGLSPIKILPIISYIEPNSTAATSGLKEGDKIVQINNVSSPSWNTISKTIKDNHGQELTFIIKRKTAQKNIKLIPELYNNDGQIGGKIGIMPTLDLNFLKKNSFTQRYNWIEAITYGFSASYNVMKFNLNSLTAIISGKISWHNISGPISIANAGVKSLNGGIKNFVDFLALISLSLAFMNLLPIPSLDGGHILVYTYEWITNKKINNQFQVLILSFGMVLILALTFIALYNDILRIFN